MSNFPICKQAPAEGLFEIEPLSSSSSISAALPKAARYHFNLTDGDTLIQDEDGVEASSIQAAVLSALEAVEELRAQDLSNSDEWRGWRLEVVDSLGRAVQSIPLDNLSAH
jgi:bifunctional DNA-binding transcriptional regulator/antitoxin component of YhaV-PrlF toxin-antitoxin module